jgi:cystathionine beta-lyase/cystathionine gamma-synthase
MGFLTDSIHAGQSPERNTGAVVTPIFQTSTYAQKELGADVKYDYARVGNPTREALENNIAALEQGTFGCAFGSGMAAISAIFQMLSSGDHVLVTNNVYGGTYRYLTQVEQRNGLEFDFIETSNIEQIRVAGRDSTKMIFIETPTNPMLTLTDIRAVAEISKKNGWMLVVDNTFLSPYFQRPLTLGADIVVHSATKYLAGHSDVILGITVTDNEDIQENLKFLQKSTGAVPGPFDCWLVLRSTKTLGLRMRQHEVNARKIANFLRSHDNVSRVHYPGLEKHAGHSLAKKQQTDPHGEPGFGGMLSIELASVEEAKEFVHQVEIFTLGESLGGVESLISHPVSMTHASVPKQERLKFGLTDSLVRLSVGCEDTEDLIAELSRALASVQ